MRDDTVDTLPKVVRCRCGKVPHLAVSPLGPRVGPAQLTRYQVVCACGAEADATTVGEVTAIAAWNDEHGRKPKPKDAAEGLSDLVKDCETLLTVMTLREKVTEARKVLDDWCYAHLDMNLVAVMGLDWWSEGDHACVSLVRALGKILTEAESL